MDDKAYETKDTFLKVRMSPSEYLALKEKAAEMNCTLAQSVRTILFQKKALGTVAGDGVMSKTEIAKRRLVTLQSLHGEYKKIASTYISIAEDLKRTLKKQEEKKFLDGNAYAVVRAFRSLEDKTLAMQESINELFHQNGTKEDWGISRTQIPEPQMKKEGPVKTSETPKPQREKEAAPGKKKVTAHGIVTEAAARYKPKKGDGKEGVRFKITCRTNKGTQQIYTVFSKDFSKLDTLTPGVKVTVEGIYTMTENGDRLIFAKTVEV